MSALTTKQRRNLRIGTALATGIIGIMSGPAALAQNIPNNTFPSVSGVGATADQAQIGSTGTTMTVNMTSSVANGSETRSRNIVWSDFSIGESNTVSFVTNPAGAGINVVALNTVTNAAPISVIEGNITAQSNIAVWLINPQGMLFSSTSSFSGASLILSTLTPRDIGVSPASNDDLLNILDGDGAVELGITSPSDDASANAITVDAGATFASSGNVAMISQQIDMGGAITADGDVGLILGHGISMTSAAASPLSYTIEAGTRIDGSPVSEPTARLIAGGSITGANVKLYAVSEDAVTGALLQVSSGATLTASAANGSVILLANDEGGGVANLSSSGSLIATSTTGEVSVTSTDGNATVNGAVTVGGTGNFTVSGDTVILGGAGAVTHGIAGAATITADDGNITANSDLTLNAASAVFDASATAQINSKLAIGGALTITGTNVTLGNGTDARLQEATGLVTVTASTGTLTISTGIDLQSNGGAINLDASDGDVIVRGRAVANGNLSVTAGPDGDDDIQIASPSGNNGYLISETGDTLVQAGGSIYAFGGLETDLPVARGTFGYVTDGNLTLTSDGDVHVSELTAGGNLSVTIDNGTGTVRGALLGAPTANPALIAGGSVQATAGKVTIVAEGNAILREIIASDVEVSADNLAVGQITLNVTGGGMDLFEDDGTTVLDTANQYIGRFSQVDDLTVTLTGRPETSTDVTATMAQGAFESAFGKANLTATAGTLTVNAETGAQLGAVDASGAINITAGGVLADTVDSGSTIDITATTGTLALGIVTSAGALALDKQGGLITTAGDELRLTDGTVTAGGATLDSSTSIRVGDLVATSGAVSLTATAGDISGLLTGTTGALSQVSTGAVLDADYGSANLESGDNTVTATATLGGVQLGTVTAGTDLTVTGRAASLNTVTAGQDLTIDATVGTLVIGSATAGRNVDLAKTGGLIATAGDELRIITEVVGGDTTLGTGTSVTSSTHVRAAVIEDLETTVGITATLGDVVISNRVYGEGNVSITAGRDVQIAEFTGTFVGTTASGLGYVQSKTGSVLIDAARSVYGIGGSATTLPATPGVGSDYFANGNLEITGVGDLLAGSITATGSITFNLTGGIYGTTGTSGADLGAGAVFGAGAVTVNANGVGGVNVLNRAESTGGNLILKGDKIAIGRAAAFGTRSYLNLANNPIDPGSFYEGLITITCPILGPCILAPNTPTTYSGLIAQEVITAGPTYGTEKFEAALGNADLTAGSTISGTITGAAQLGTVISGDAITLTAGALVANSVNVAVDSLNITATTGTLSILDALVDGSMTLIKNGGLITNPGDDLRVLTATTGGSIDLASSTSIRVGSLDSGIGNIVLTATSGDISGMLLGTAGALGLTSTTPVLDADYAAAGLTSGGTITATAANGAVQLGTVQGDAGISATALAIGAASLTTTAASPLGTLSLTATGGSLNIGTATISGDITLNKSGGAGALRFASLSGLAMNIDSNTDVIGTTLTSTGGFTQIDAANNITITTVNVDSGNLTATNDAQFGAVTATNDIFVGGIHDLTAVSVRSTNGEAVAAAGRHVTITSDITGATLAQGFAGAFDVTGILTAPLISSVGQATATSNGNAFVDALTGDAGATVDVDGNYAGDTIVSSLGAIGLTVGGDISIDSATAGTGITGTVGSLHAISLDANGGSVTINAATGDIAGQLTGTPETLAVSTSGTTLSSEYGKLNVEASGGISLTAASGAMQLGTLDAGLGITGSARAITADQADANGDIGLTATEGTLYLGAGDAGLSLALTKTGTLSEMRFGTLISGTAVLGASGATTLSSTTNIRGTSIIARGGAISVTAIAGEVTGLSGGRMALSALPDLDALAAPIALTDSSVTVVSGLLARLGNVVAGTDISVTAGTLGSATLGGAINMLDANSLRGTVTLTSSNDGIATNGIVFEDLTGTSITYRARGTASGDVSGQSAIGSTVVGSTSTGNLYVVLVNGSSFADQFATIGDVRVDTLQSGLGGSFITAGDDIILGTATTTGFLDLSAGGDVTGASGFTNTAANRPDLSAASLIEITAGGSVQLDQAMVSAGNIDIRAGSVTADGSIDINNAQASTSIQLAATATGTPDDANHDGTVRVNTATAGTTLTLSNVLFGGTIGDVVVDTSAIAGNGALATATANDARFDAAENARIESATALTGTIAVRAGDAIGASNLAQGAEFAAGEDLALKSGSGINLGISSAGDDLIIESTDTITVGELTASGSNAALDNRTVSFASATSIAIAGPETNLGASIVVRSSTGSVNATDTLTALNGSVTIEAADAANVTGDVDAGINFTVDAVNDIVLGGGGTTSQSADGLVTITSSNGQVSDGAGALTLTANADGVGTEALTITALDGILIDTATLVGGNGGKQSDVVLTSGGGAIELAGIDAARLIASASTGFTSAAAISVGSAATAADPAAGPSTVDIRVTSGNIQADDVTALGAGHDIRLAASGTITTGALSAARSVIVNGVTSGSASGAFSADSVTSSSGPVNILATTISVTGATNSNTSMTLEATAGDITLDTASTTNGAMTLTASGAIEAVTLTSVGGGITGEAGSMNITGLIDAGGALSLTTTGGDLVLDAAESAGLMTLTSSAALTAVSLTSVGGDIVGEAASIGITGLVNAGGALTLTTTGGDLVLDAAESAGLMTLTSSDALTAVTLTSVGGDIVGEAASIGITGLVNAGGALTLTTTGGDLVLDAAESNGLMTLTSSDALTAVSLTSFGGDIVGEAASIDVTGDVDAGGALTLTTIGGDLVLDDTQSAGVMTLTSSAALTAASLTSVGGEIIGEAASIDVTGAVDAGGALTLTTTGGDLSIGSGSASGAVELTATDTISTGGFNAGANTVTLTAADADITGAITGSTITVANNGGASNLFRIGDGAEGTGGFELNAAEINFLSAPSVVLDAGTGTGLTQTDVAIGDLALSNAALGTLDINAMLRVDMTGSVTKAAGSGLTGLRIGGTATETDLAAVMRIAAQADGTGGLIDLGDAALELRAAKIGMGQDAGFLDLIGIGPGASGTPLDARLMVSNPASSLYNSAALGGTIYQTAGQVVIRANTMVVRYSDFALFQNTGLPGANEGVRLANSASPQAPALRIIGPTSPIGGPFGMFGEINGIRDTATALLGEGVINVISVDRTSARINGCLVGSGAGCLTTLAISPTLGTFDPVRGSIFFANADFELPFDPLVGTNNDSLFGDVGTFGLEDVPLESIDCSDAEAGAACTAPEGDKK